MDSHFHNNIELDDEEQEFILLQDLERQNSREIRKQRAHERVPIKVKVILQSGNSSELLDYKVQGITGDLSEEGCRAMFPIPVNVGDIYRLHFDKTTIKLPLVFARCMRCKLIREDAYEAGFSFFLSIRLPETVTSKDGSELL